MNTNRVTKSVGGELMSHELIHTTPVQITKLGVLCSSCIVELPVSIQAYPHLSEFWCKSCAHYMHEHSIQECSICTNEEVNGMYIEFLGESVVIHSKTMVTVIDNDANLMEEIRKIEAIESIPSQR